MHMAQQRTPVRDRMTGLLLAMFVQASLAIGGDEIVVRRFSGNPLVSFASSESLGNKINGPSVIRVPSWVEAPLGKYYMYFAHHKGKFIRLAYADSLRGPWTVYEPGTLHVSEAEAFVGHIASPDVHVDNEARVIRMYFHGSRRNENQKTGVAISTDGLRFKAAPTILGDAYFRVFTQGEFYYAIDTFGELNRSRHPERGWTKRGRPLVSPVAVDDEYGRRTNVRIRHSAVWVEKDTLYLFFTRKTDAPERILLTRVPMEGDWSEWRAEEPVEVMRPETSYEGIDYPIAPSRKGGAINVQQLRDPYVFEDNRRLYLFYAAAGEMGIAAARIVIRE